MRSVERRARRQRIEWTEDENRTLRDAVRRLGPKWTVIRQTYRFHPQRTPADIKEHHSRMIKV